MSDPRITIGYRLRVPVTRRTLEPWPVPQRGWRGLSAPNRSGHPGRRAASRETRKG